MHPLQADTAENLSFDAVRSRIVIIETAFDDLTARGVDAVMLRNGAMLVGHAKTSIQQSEARYRHLINQMGGYVAELLPSGEILYLNEAMAKLLGCNAAALGGFDFFEKLLPSQMAVAPQALRDQFLRGGELKAHRTGFWAADGSLRVLSWNSAHVTSPDKQLERLIFLAQDFTQQVHAEQEMRIAAIAFEAQEGMVVTDAHGTILRVNQAFSDITGYSTSEVIGQNPRFLSSGRHDAAFYAALWADVKQHGMWQGEIWNRRKSAEVFPEWLTITAVKDDAGVVTQYVGSFVDSTLRKEAADQIERLAFYDPLTQLANRRLMLDRLKRALASCQRRTMQGALMLIDIDNFKSLNDTLGHDVGDSLLVEVARRLNACVRVGDTVARFGGDEFIIILEDLDASSQAVVQAESIALKILERLRQSYALGAKASDMAGLARKHDCTASIGVTLFPDGQLSTDDLIKHADLAMYQAKAAGRNTVRFFDPAMQAAIIARAALEADLRRAILGQQFVVYFQSQVNARGRILGAETLVRWHHPERGLTGPDEFIPLAEETGLILELGYWVLQQACLQLVAWAHDPAKSFLTLAVNVSAHQFHHDDFLVDVSRIIQDTGVNPNRLKLELTESLLIKDLPGVVLKMQALKDIGVIFSLDDFGTGYSSLAYLKLLPFDQLKIDQSFVRDVLTDPNDAAIARTVVTLGHSLGLEVIAEGVETEEHRKFLANNGCMFYQGYLFSRPVPLAAFETLVTRET
jgi:diguanylate cyclase (GGDEF)-like protein/PAS domain S-box-containing protein